MVTESLKVSIQIKIIESCFRISENHVSEFHYFTRYIFSDGLSNIACNLYDIWGIFSLNYIRNQGSVPYLSNCNRIVSRRLVLQTPWYCNDRLHQYDFLITIGIAIYSQFSDRLLTKGVNLERDVIVPSKLSLKLKKCWVFSYVTSVPRSLSRLVLTCQLNGGFPARLCRLSWFDISIPSSIHINLCWANDRL